MIREAEVRRTAAAKKVDPMVIDLDYSLGWILLGMKNISPDLLGLIFKGGTCLCKCYFPDYRFSEDLDFTATTLISETEIKNVIESSFSWILEHDGPDFFVGPLRFEIVDDEYGKESFQIRVYYKGPLNWGGSPRSIKLDVTRSEKVLLPPVERKVFHPYSDDKIFEALELSCYSLEEVMAEKIRAIGGQRRFAISRDLYDIYNLLDAGVNLETVKKILPEKFRTKGLNLGSVDVGSLENRYSEFEHDCDRRLQYLVPRNEKPFENVWGQVVSLINQLINCISFQ